MTNEQKTNDTLVKSANTAVAVSSGAIQGFEHFEGFDTSVVVEHTPYIVLLQGKNPMFKKYEGSKEGDLLINGEIVTKPINITLLASGIRYNELSYTITKEGAIDTSKATTIGKLTTVEYTDLPGRRTNIKDDVIVTDSSGEIRVFNKCITMVVLYDGFPHKIVFKTNTKRKQAEEILAFCMMACKKNNVNSIQGLTLTLGVEAVTNKDGQEFYMFKALKAIPNSPEVNTTVKELLTYLAVDRIAEEDHIND